MEPRDALGWEPPAAWRRVVAIDSHAGGEPFRLLVDGIPPIEGNTMVERRRHAQTHLDDLRRALMWEPRGHADMYGGIIGPPVDPTSDLSVLFLHNEGFSTMCGHGIIALTKVVIETGLFPAEAPETVLRIDTPAGQVISTATVDRGSVVAVRFHNVASFVIDLDEVVDVGPWGSIRYDLAFGGAFYGYVDGGDVGLDLSPGNVTGLIEAGVAIKRAITETRTIPHPIEPALGFLYGVIFVGPPQEAGHHSRNVCIFANGEVDRSPTGTGVSGRLAIHHARSEIGVGETIVVESILGSTFTGRVVAETEHGGLPAIVPEIGGTAHITGRNELWVDPADRLGQGFLIR